MNTYFFVLFTNRTALIHNTTEAHDGKTEDEEVIKYQVPSAVNLSKKCH